jgi:hypothetical protein
MPDGTRYRKGIQRLTLANVQAWAQLSLSLTPSTLRHLLKGTLSNERAGKPWGGQLARVVHAFKAREGDFPPLVDTVTVV